MPAYGLTSCPLFKISFDGKEAMFVILRKHITLFQELALIAPVSAVSDVADDDGQHPKPLSQSDTYNVSFLSKQRKLFSFSNVEPVSIDFDKAEFIDLAYANKIGIAIEKIGEVDVQEFGRIQGHINALLDKVSFLQDNSYSKFLSAVVGLLSATYATNGIWQRLYKDRLTPQRQVSNELEENEKTRQAAQAYMSRNIPLSRAIDMAKYGENIAIIPPPATEHILDRENIIAAQVVEENPAIDTSIPEASLSNPEIALSGADLVHAIGTIIERQIFQFPEDAIFIPAEVDLNQLPKADETETGFSEGPNLHADPLPSIENPDPRSVSLAAAIEMGLFNNGNAFDCGAFLKKPKSPKAPQTLFEAYMLVKKDPKSLMGLFDYVGPAVSCRLAEKISAAFDRLSPKNILDLPLDEAIGQGFFNPAAGEITDYANLLSHPTHRAEGTTLKTIYHQVSQNPEALAGQYQFVGPKVSRRIAEKIMRVVSSYEDKGFRPEGL